MASPVCIAAVASPRTGARLPSRRSSPSAVVALSSHVTLCRRSLPTRGLCHGSAGADSPEPAFVAVAEKLDAARKARAAAGIDDDLEEVSRTGAIDDVVEGVEEPVAAVPFAPFEQSLVSVDSVGDGALSQGLGSKSGFEETSTYVMYGTGAIFAGWILFAVVSAMDSIPLLPKMLEIVGLGYTVWFSTRYLLFKENRDELRVKVEGLKKRIVGSGDE